MSEKNKDLEEEKQPQAEAPEKAAETPDNGNKKRRALLVYLCIIFAAAFLLVAISLVVRIHTMKEDFNEANSQAGESYAALEGQAHDMESKAQIMEEKAHASELLTMAQNSYYKEDIQSFHEYMGKLAECSDSLSGDMKTIYEDLKIIEGELK